ncbi:MAG TPA: hypothetical protein VF916_12335, partial [Ktedonobacterales bacterium]
LPTGRRGPTPDEALPASRAQPHQTRATRAPHPAPGTAGPAMAPHAPKPIARHAQRCPGDRQARTVAHDEAVTPWWLWVSQRVESLFVLALLGVLLLGGGLVLSASSCLSIGALQVGGGCTPHRGGPGAPTSVPAAHGMSEVPTDTAALPGLAQLLTPLPTPSPTTPGEGSLGGSGRPVARATAPPAPTPVPYANPILTVHCIVRTTGACVIVALTLVPDQVPGSSLTCRITQTDLSLLQGESASESCPLTTRARGRTTSSARRCRVTRARAATATRS